MIEISDELRVRDYDKDQYVIERRMEIKGEKTRWVPAAYVGSGTGLFRKARSLFADNAAEHARRAAYKEYDASWRPEALRALPKKPDKVE